MRGCASKTLLIYYLKYYSLYIFALIYFIFHNEYKCVRNAPRVRRTLVSIELFMFLNRTYFHEYSHISISFIYMYAKSAYPLRTEHFFLLSLLICHRRRRFSHLFALYNCISIHINVYTGVLKMI